MKKEENVNMDSYFKKIKEILDQLRGIDFIVLQELIVLFILNSLPT
jgi:hypothetical protein